MPLQKLQFRPGINREITSYSNEGGWHDCDKVRFTKGYPEKIGGWTKKGILSFLGTARALHPWRDLIGTRLIGVGTDLKFYAEEGGGYNDITPIRKTVNPSIDMVVTVAGESAEGSVGSVTATSGLASIADVPEAVGFVSSVAVNTDGANVMVLVPVSDTLSATGSVGSVSLTGNLDETVTLEGVQAAATTDGIAINTVQSVVRATFSATPGSSTLVVRDVGHGAVANDFVTFSQAISLGGNITAGVLNQEYQITEVLDSDNYTIEAREAGTSISSITVDGQLVPTPVLADASDINDGGIDTISTYQINTGLSTALAGNGWGSSFWGRGAWGSATNINTVTQNLRTWSQDNFGEDLIFNPRNGGVYYWDRSESYTTYQRAVPVSALPGASGAPTIARAVLVSNRDRHVIAFGCDPVDDIGTQDPLLIRFSDQENAANWTPTATNTAGDLRISSGSEIITVFETRQQVLVFTDTSLHAMQYLGPPFTFGINLISENTSIQGPMSGVAVDDMVFWMGQTEFYMYNGSVQRIPCSVRSYVFDDFNFTQGDKVFAGLNSAHSEIWWFYPSASSDTVDRYVVFNYQDNVWFIGSLPRSAWVDRGAFESPIAAGLDGHLYEHEVGFDDGSTSPASAINSYIQSSPMDIGDGEQFSFIRRVFPDVAFKNSTAENPSVDITLNVRNISGGAYLRSSTGVYYDDDRQQLDFRLRGRQFSFKVSGDEVGVTWRLGSPRVDLRPDGRR